jgi:hypothetical protein
VWWVAIFFGLDYITSFMLTFAEFWNKVIVFIILGRGCYVISEGLSAEEGAKS